MKYTLTYLLLLGFFGLSIPAFAQAPINDDKSEVKFSIKNAGVTVIGYFHEINGKINWNPDNPSLSSFKAIIPVKSIDTDIDMRDEHLRSNDYFEESKYPNMQFESTRIEKQGNGFLISGNLTIKDVTRTISFPFTVEKTVGGYRFNGSFVIDRRDFHVGGNSWIMGDDVTVMLEIEA